MPFLSSIPPLNERNLSATHDLVLIELQEDGAQYLHTGGNFVPFWRWLAFSSWWEHDPIFSSGSGKGQVSRKSLVLNLRDKEGGAHYDAEVAESDYSKMATNPVWVFKSNDQEHSELVGLELASMRQVAFEVLETLKKAGLHT